ncbi:ABC transporter permease [Subtercola sp. YIM 133946]|uniref:ABC transporter permease n=1 Tax=Subtercola sp. YIM 133946 TaxID=3118909 RepID=UPI002F95D957
MTSLDVNVALQQPQVRRGSRIGGLLRDPIAQVITRRILFAIPLLFVVSALSFVLMRLIPGDPARQILGPSGSPEAYAALREQLGLDLPLYQQYWDWLQNAVQGNLGTSIFRGESVVDILNQRLPVTFSLLFLSLLVTLIVGVTLGVLSAVRGGATGRGIDVLSQLGFILPSFWVAAVLVSIFAVQLRLLPAVGYVPIDDSVADWLRSLVLPVAAIALASVAAVARQTREAMLDVLGSEHIRMARANGIPPHRILLRYALKPAGTRVMTMLGLEAVSLLGGTVFIESVFAMPGLGSIAVSATYQQDVPLVVGVTVYFTILVVIVNLIVDLMYTWLDPRVRTA